MAGISEGYEQIAIRGTPAKESFCAFYLKDGALLAVHAVNRPADFMVSKKLIAERTRAAATQLADERLPLKSLLLR
jgi:3-phenylpropionate/trans-cinnamate dioxygenase ferredoxin reductase subunit